LEGTQCGFLSSFSGGEATADVLREPRSTAFVRKHLANVRYEPITISFGLGLARTVYEWIEEAWNDKPGPRQGSITAVGASGAVRTLEFEDAVIVETTLPRLDAGAKEVASIELTIAPTRTEWRKASGPVASQAAKQKQWLAANFKLEIAGLDCSRVAKIDALPVPGSSPVDFPALRVTAAASSQQTWTDWRDEFVVKGLNDDTHEKSGSLVYLAPDVKTKLGTVKFSNLGIFRLGSASDEQPRSAIARFVAELYCEKMELVI
jgi:hypothetical protein